MSESVTVDTTDLDTTIIGQVKWFNVKAGYGFITVVSPTSEHKGKDIFVHYSALSVENSLYRYLVQGEYVEFKLVKPVNDQYELHASGVSGLFGGSIMCENRVREDQARSQRIRPDVPPRREQQPRITAASAAVAPEDDGFQQVQRRKSNKA